MTEQLVIKGDNHPIDPPVTITITRLVKPGCEAKFEQLISEVSQTANSFPGHLGTNLFRPDANTKSYQIIYKFDCLSNFHQWETSKVRADYYKKIRPLLLTDPKIQVLTGLETWFNLPGQGALVPPPRYKMATVSWIAIYPLVILILELLQPILNPLPIPFRAGIITLIAIPSMTYILMPRMTKWFANWLYPRIPEKISTDS